MHRAGPSGSSDMEFATPMSVPVAAMAFATPQAHAQAPHTQQLTHSSAANGGMYMGTAPFTPSFSTPQAAHGGAASATMATMFATHQGSEMGGGSGAMVDTATPPFASLYSPQINTMPPSATFEPVPVATGGTTTALQRRGKRARSFDDTPVTTQMKFQNKHLADRSDHALLAQETQRRLIQTAQRRLYSGAAQQTLFAEPMQEGMERCHICTNVSPVVKCTFCDKVACEKCVNQCDECHDTFCSFCSTPNYDRSCDRHFCLECNSDLADDDGMGAYAPPRSYSNQMETAGAQQSIRRHFSAAF